MKGVILEIDPEAKVVDLDHSVAPQDIRQGAYALYSATPWFPFAVHVGVVDPGVGTERRGGWMPCGGARVGRPAHRPPLPPAGTVRAHEVPAHTEHDYTLP